jgi:hypothetical protein
MPLKHCQKPQNGGGQACGLRVRRRNGLKLPKYRYFRDPRGSRVISKIDRYVGMYYMRHTPESRLAIISSLSLPYFNCLRTIRLVAFNYTWHTHSMVISSHKACTIVLISTSQLFHSSFVGPRFLLYPFPSKLLLLLWWPGRPRVSAP